MKLKFYIVIFFLVQIKIGESQVLYNPTLVYDTNGEMFDNSSIQSLYLNFYNNNYHDSLTSWWFTKNENRFAASLDFNNVHFDSVGVKYKGNSTFFIANTLNNPKVPYNIDINYYVGGQKLLNYKKLKLGNALFDPTFMKEVLASNIYNQYLPSHETSLIKLFVNNNYLGVYSNTESINKQFLTKHFNEKNGAFYKCEPDAQYGSNDPYFAPDLIYRGTDTLQYNLRYERKNDTAWTNLIDFIDILNNDINNIENILNVDRVLWYFAVNQVLLNEDTYNTMFIHNYYLYQLGDGRFQIIPWDLSESFCGGLLGQLNSYDEHYLRDPRHGLTPLINNKPLVYQLLSIPKYEKLYYAHINTIIENSMDTTQIRNWINNYQSLAAADVFTDINKVFTYDHYYLNIDSVLVVSTTTHLAAIMKTLEHRLPYLDTLMILNNSQPNIINVNQNISSPLAGENVYITAQVTNASTVNLMSTTSIYNSDFTPTIMHDDGINGDAIASDGIYTALIPFNSSLDHVKYYIKAENTNSVKLKPQRAEYFFYHYVVDYYLSELNENNTFKFNLYPNPASKSVSIKTVNFETKVLIKIFDVNGKTIFNKQMNNTNNIKIDVSTLNNGIYFVSITDNKHSLTKKLMINH